LSVEVTEIQLLWQQIADQVDGRIADVLKSLSQEDFEQLREVERLEHFKRWLLSRFAIPTLSN
jgi:hypothetical protein